MDKVIFFIDDDKMILNLMQYTFSNRDNCKVFAFSKGEDCLPFLDKNPNIFVIDHSFVNNSIFNTGLEIIDKIRETYAGASFIVLTGSNDSAIRKQYEQRGVTSFINKDSFFIDILIEKIACI